MSDERGRVADTSIEEVLDPGAAQRREEEAREHAGIRARRQAWLKQIMQHPEGRVWLKELLDEMHAFETRFASVNGLAPDPYGSWFLAGQQKCGWKLWEQFDEADPVLASRIRRGENL